MQPAYRILLTVSIGSVGLLASNAAAQCCGSSAPGPEDNMPSFTSVGGAMEMASTGEVGIAWCIDTNDNPLMLWIKKHQELSATNPFVKIDAKSLAELPMPAVSHLAGVKLSEANSVGSDEARQVASQRIEKAGGQAIVVTDGHGNVVKAWVGNLRMGNTRNELVRAIEAAPAFGEKLQKTLDRQIQRAQQTWERKKDARRTLRDLSTIADYVGYDAVKQAETLRGDILAHGEEQLAEAARMLDEDRGAADRLLRDLERDYADTPIATEAELMRTQQAAAAR